MIAAPRVLVVEDNFLLLNMLTIQFELVGLTVVAVSSGEAALTVLRTLGASVDWLLTDINLPGLIDGWTVAEAYRDLRPDRPVIYASTDAQFADRPLQGSLTFRKPFLVREIVALARMMAGERRPSAASVPERALG